MTNMLKAMILICCHSFILGSNNNDLRYHQVAYLCAHNAFSAKEHGYPIYAQQQWSIKKQLEHGVRALMLDTHLYKNSALTTIVKTTEKTGQEIASWFGKKKPAEPEADEIYLCHGPCDLTAAFLMDVGKRPQRLKTALNTIATFLKENPTEIVTIFLEDYVKDAKKLDAAFQQVKDFLLVPADWDPKKEKGWPTLSWMQKNNKRLVVFNQTMQTKLLWSLNNHVVRNHWSTTDMPEVCRMLNKKNLDRYLYLFDYYPYFYLKDFTDFANFFHKKYKNTVFSTLNSTSLKKTLTSCVKRGLEYCSDKDTSCSSTYYYAARYPNFIALDFVNEGNPLALIKEINAMPNKDEIFRVMKN